MAKAIVGKPEWLDYCRPSDVWGKQVCLGQYDNGRYCLLCWVLLLFRLADAPCVGST